ncbi:MAG: DUF2911 domain-containing protein [Thermoanaerobaculia bacterium]
MRTVLALLLLCPMLANAAQIRLPEPSPQATVSQEIGISTVTISFHRPGVKGRTIWGGLVPWNETWRLGANEATTIELSHAATIEGHAVDAGKYAFFAIPGREKWTLILNSRSEQWGAYFHDPSRDVLRFEVKPVAAPFEEWMKFAIDPVADDTLEAAMQWERLRVPFRIRFPVRKMVWGEIDRVLRDPARASWDDFHTAARYALTTGERLDEAMKWIERSMEKEESFWNYELKARLLRARGERAEALAQMGRAIATAEGKAPKEYIEGLKKTLAEWKIE